MNDTKTISYKTEKDICGEKIIINYWSLNHESINYDDTLELDDAIAKQLGSGMKYGIAVKASPEKDSEFVLLAEWCHHTKARNFLDLDEVYGAIIKMEQDMGIQDYLYNYTTEEIQSVPYECLVNGLIDSDVINSRKKHGI